MKRAVQLFQNRGRHSSPRSIVYPQSRTTNNRSGTFTKRFDHLIDEVLAQSAPVMDDHRSSYDLLRDKLVHERFTENMKKRI